MRFLYLFEVVYYDGALTSTAAPASVDATSGIRRTVYPLTNCERQVEHDSAPFLSAFLPNLIVPATYTFLPTPGIEHQGLRLDSERKSGQLTVKLPSDHPISQLYALDAPPASVHLKLAVVDDDKFEPGHPDYLRVVWVGDIRAGSFEGLRCKLTGAHIIEMTQRAAFTRKHPRACGHNIYDSATCRLNPHRYDAAASYFAFREDGTVAGITASNTTLTVQEALNRQDGFFAGGFVVIEPAYSQNPDSAEIADAFYPREDGPVSEQQAAAAAVHGGYRRDIASHQGSQLELTAALPPSIPAGARVTLYAGCAHTPEACIAFGNRKNYGGYEHIPSSNPFETGLKQ